MWIVTAQLGLRSTTIRKFETEIEAISFCELRRWQYCYSGQVSRLNIMYCKESET